MKRRIHVWMVIACLMGAVKLSAQTCNVNFSIGPDTTINCNTQYTIQATPGMGMYHWNTGSTASSITVSQPGTYWCIGSDTLANVVVNGDFSQGQTGFMSDYIPGTGGSWGVLSLEGQYAVTANSNWVHTNFVNCFDHTTGNASGSMLVVNGASVPNQVIWRQIVNVSPNTNYIFSVWGMSAVSTNPGQLVFSVNGTQLGSTLNLPFTTCLWQNFFIMWNSGANVTADIAILNQNSAVSGNDFAIDDISFAPICMYGDTMVLTNPPHPIVSVSPNDTICPGQSATLSATSNIAGSTFSWNPGSLSGSPLSVSPVLTTAYTVIATSPQGCTSTPQQVTVWVAPVPQVTVSGSTDSICPGENVTLTATASFLNCSFLWQPGSLGGSPISVSPAGTTTYIATATSPNGCTSAPDSFTVVVKPVPVVTVSGDTICSGETTTLTAASNVAGSSYQWQPGGSTNASVNVSPAVTTNYTVTAEADGCTSLPDIAEVMVNPVPSLTVPGPQTICPGEELTATVSSDVTGSVFFWQPGNLTGNQQTLSPDTNTYYTVYAEANGCTSPTDSFLVEISTNCNCLVIVPDVFTPNGDMINEIFHTINSSGCNFIDFDFAIYTRWGNKVWQSNDANAEWDGKFNGTGCSEGTYFWTMHYTHEGAGNPVKATNSGTLTIFK